MKVNKDGDNQYEKGSLFRDLHDFTFPMVKSPATKSNLKGKALLRI